MADTPITKLTSLDIKGNSKSAHNGFYAPQLTTSQRDVIAANTVRNGGIIYNTDDNEFQLYENSSWKKLYSSSVFRTGTVTIGNIGAADGLLESTGAILTANATSTKEDEIWVTVVAVTYKDLGYIPMPLASTDGAGKVENIQDSSGPRFKDVSATGMSILYTKARQAVVTDITCNIMLVKPDLT